MLTLTRHGQTLHFDDSGFGALPYVYGPLTAGRVYEEEFLEYVRSLGRVGEYVDVGAHLGTHSLWFAKMCPATRVHAIEPVGRYADVVRRNVAANELEGKVTIHQTGLARERGLASNYMSKEHQIGFVDGDARGVTERFEVVPMDDIVRGPVVLIKLDVEGMEAEVLRGATRILSEHRPVIFAEAQSWAAARRIMRALAPFGYRLTGRIFNASPTYEFSANPVEGWSVAHSAYARLHPMVHWGRRMLRAVVMKGAEPHPTGKAATSSERPARRKLIPAQVRRWAWQLAGLVDRGERVACPVCGSGLNFFLPFGVGGRVRFNALCPVCQSLERDRAAWLELSSSRAWLEPAPRLLHVAPERCLEPRLRQRLGSRYITADLLRTDVDHQVSVEDLPFDDGRFDAIICNHVLEHVNDDRKALSELRRILSPGGWALLQVPLDETQHATAEDPTVTSPRERKRRFGQHDHVRAYGRDYLDRLRSAGFVPELRRVGESHSLPEIVRHGLDREEILHFCRRA